MISDHEDFVYEYDGPPLAIVDDIAVSADNDASLIGDSVTTPTISSLLAPYEDISLALSRFEQGIGERKTGGETRTVLQLGQSGKDDGVS